MNRQRRSFALVERLVVIAVMGILVGWLLPAINAARDPPVAVFPSLATFALTTTSISAFGNDSPTGVEPPSPRRHRAAGIKAESL
jgi:competence protein ComGC